MKHALMGAAMAALLTGLAPAGTAQAQHMSRLDRSAADQAMEAIGLHRSDENRISFERSDFRAGIYTFTNVTFHYTPDPEATDTDKGAAADDTGVQDPEPREIHADRMRLDSPRLDANGNLLLHGFELEGLSESDAQSSFLIRQMRLERPNPEMSADLGRMLRGDEVEETGSRWDLYRFGLLAMDDLTVTGSETDAAFELHLDRLAFRDYTTDTLGRFEFLGLAVQGQSEGEPVTASLAEISVDGLKTSSYSGLMEALAAGADEAELSAAYYAADPEDQMDMFDRAQIRGFDLEAPGISSTLDEIVMTMDRRHDGIWSHVHMGSLRLVPDSAAEAGAQLASAIGLLGYDELEMSLESNTVYDPEAGRAYTTGENYIQLRDGLRLDMVQDFGGYHQYLANIRAMSDRLAQTEDPDQSAALVLEALGPLSINRIALRLQDLSMLDRAIKAGAAAQGMTPEELRAQSGLMIAAGMMAAPPELPQALVTEAATALTSFVNQGGTLVIEMAPPELLTIADLMAQVESKMFDFTALGLRIAAEPPAGD
ncbi:hypothetical protein [Maricaulis sp.]|uniref:hypothetical protein n=1 Tax=Maricaulis sp. TaxID=1486257 RepID=UPI003A8FE111